MLRKVEVFTTNPLIPPLTLPVLGNDGMGPLHIRNIEGLGSIKAEINSRGYGLLDGEYFTGAHIGKRNIVMTLGVNPEAEFNNMGALRKHLLGYLRTTLNVILRFTTDEHPLVQIEGFVEDFDAPMFEKDPEIHISIICPKPFFKSVQDKFITGYASNTPTDITFIYDTQLTNGAIFRLFRGASNYTGFVNVEMSSPGRPFRKFEIYALTVNTTQYYEANTNQGSKKVELLNVTTKARISNLLGSLSSESLWLYVVPGTNYIRVKINSSVQMLWTLTYNERFGGI